MKRVFKGKHDKVYSLCFSHDGHHLISIGQRSSRGVHAKYWRFDKDSLYEGSMSQKQLHQFEHFDTSTPSDDRHMVLMDSWYTDEYIDDEAYQSPPGSATVIICTLQPHIN